MVAGALCLLLVVGDVVAGSWVERRVGERLGCRLGASDGADVDVSGWPASLSLLTGTVPSVRVTAPDAHLSPQLEGDLAVDLHDVRRTGDGMSTGGGRAEVTVPWSQVEQRLDRPGIGLSGADGDVVATVETGLVPLAVVARPRVTDGRLTLDPTGVRVGDRELSGGLADRLVARMGGGAALLGDGLVVPAPAGLSLTAATGTADGLELTLDLAPGPLGSGLGGGRC
ncbi:hypothetical protein HIDPHFAB_01810 [Nocardioides sp. T2.26MG-1]|nr:hypothetical protein HIDPHFAB_01810 [Nocardioides sp. T2.26MG-1]